MPVEKRYDDDKYFQTALRSDAHERIRGIASLNGMSHSDFLSAIIRLLPAKVYVTGQATVLAPWDPGLGEVHKSRMNDIPVMTDEPESGETEESYGDKLQLSAETPETPETGEPGDKQDKPYDFSEEEVTENPEESGI